MITAIVSIVLILVAAILISAAIRPTLFTVTRTVTIKATPDKIMPYINDFKKWAAWSPYDKRDPNMQKTYTGPSVGVGSTYEWTGNNQVGAGKISISSVHMPTKVEMKLSMYKPMAGENEVAFLLKQSGGTTDVTWKMDGSYGFMAKLMGLFMDMDHMIGGDFETGLANLKLAVEK